MSALRRAVGGRAIRVRAVRDGDGWDYEIVPLDPEVIRPHLADGTKSSRTGRNLRALCGATVRPDVVPGLDRCRRICATCRSEAERRGLVQP